MVIETDSPPQRIVMTAFREVSAVFSVRVTVMSFLPALPDSGSIEIQVSVRVSWTEACQSSVASKLTVCFRPLSAPIDTDSASWGIRIV